MAGSRRSCDGKEGGQRGSGGQVEEVEVKRLFFILGGNSCFQCISFPIGLRECSLTIWKWFPTVEGGQEAGAIHTPPSLPGPSGLLRLPQGSPNPTSYPCSLTHPPNLVALNCVYWGGRAALVQPLALRPPCLLLSTPIWMMAARGIVLVPDLGLGCGDSHLCQLGSSCQGAGSQSCVTGCQTWAHPPRDSPWLPLPQCHLLHLCGASVPRCRGRGAQ